MDAGRDGINTAIEGMLGHFVGRNNVILFGEARLTPAPSTSWNAHGGWYHHFGRVMDRP